MAAGRRIRVGIVGAGADRGFAAIAHIPALRALPRFGIAAASRCDPASRGNGTQAGAVSAAVPFLARHPSRPGCVRRRA
jgi:predicted dehydrogenase